MVLYGNLKPEKMTEFQQEEHHLRRVGWCKFVIAVKPSAVGVVGEVDEESVRRPMLGGEAIDHKPTKRDL